MPPDCRGSRRDVCPDVELSGKCGGPAVPTAAGFWNRHRPVSPAGLHLLRRQSRLGNRHRIRFGSRGGRGYRTTYGKLRSASVGVGDRVKAGQTLGSSGSVTFFGLRLGETYLDPAPHLAQAEPRPQLVPLDGVNRRAPLSPRVSC
jgi:hypothetical protein